MSTQQNIEVNKVFTVVCDWDKVVGSLDPDFGKRRGVKKVYDRGDYPYAPCYEVTPAAFQKLSDDGFVQVCRNDFAKVMNRVARLNALAVGQKIRVRNYFFREVEMTALGIGCYPNGSPQLYNGTAKQNCMVFEGRVTDIYRHSDNELFVADSHTLANLEIYPKIELMFFRIRYRINNVYEIHEIKCDTEQEAVAIYEARVAERNQNKFVHCKFTPAMVYIYEPIEKEETKC